MASQAVNAEQRGEKVASGPVLGDRIVACRLMRQGAPHNPGCPGRGNAGKADDGPNGQRQHPGGSQDHEQQAGSNGDGRNDHTHDVGRLRPHAVEQARVQRCIRGSCPCRPSRAGDLAHEFPDVAKLVDGLRHGGWPVQSPGCQLVDPGRQVSPDFLLEVLRLGGHGDPAKGLVKAAVDAGVFGAAHGMPPFTFRSLLMMCAVAVQSRTFCR